MSNIQDVLVQLAGAAVIAVPLVVRAMPAALERWSKAKETVANAAMKKAEAERISATTTSTALTDFMARLDECEKQHKEAAALALAQGEQIRALQHMHVLDAEMLAKCSDKIDTDDAVIRGLRNEIAELRRSLL